MDAVIDSITQGMSRKAIRTRLRMLARISPGIATIICDHILAEQTERNIKTSTAESKVKTLLRLTRYLKQKPFNQMTKQDILSYLNSIRKPVDADPQQKWIGSYNGGRCGNCWCRCPRICKDCKPLCCSGFHRSIREIIHRK